MSKMLNEVRKAYRVLFDYQTRILHLMEFLEKSYDISFVEGNSHFSTAVSKKAKRLDLWAWDWLPMYYYEFFFHKKVEEDDLRFSAFLLNDSGFYDAELKKSDPDKLNIESFTRPEESSTKLILIAGINFWWDDWDHNTEELSKLGESGKAENGNLVYKSYDLEKFGTEEEALQTLKDFSALCKKNNIPLEISDRKINERL